MHENEVLVLTPDFPPEIGGVQTVAFRVTEGMTRFRPRVVTVSSRGANEFDRNQSFSVIRVGGGRHRRSEVLKLNARGLAEGLRRRPAAILSVHVVTGPAAIAIGRLVGSPVVQYVHAQELTRRRALARFVLRHSDAIVAVSRYSRSLVERAGGPVDRVRVIHPGVDSTAGAPGRPAGNGAIGIVARLAERYKGHDVLLRSLPIVRKEVPGATLQIVGDGPLRSELQELGTHLALGDAVVFHGSVSDERRDVLLKAVNVFAMPSRLEPSGAGEGFGIVYVEAGARGLPVVAGNVGGALDAVVDGKTGLLVDPESPMAVAEALTTILVDQQLAQEMGRAGWEYARSLSWHRATSNVESLLAELTR
jgi:phosphatidylinositol alpha-1,6-mannosyltransferase